MRSKHDSATAMTQVQEKQVGVSAPTRFLCLLKVDDVFPVILPLRKPKPLSWSCRQLRRSASHREGQAIVIICPLSQAPSALSPRGKRLLYGPFPFGVADEYVGSFGFDLLNEDPVDGGLGRSIIIGDESPVLVRTLCALSDRWRLRLASRAGAVDVALTLGLDTSSTLPNARQ